jgi:lysozyme family protein
MTFSEALTFVLKHEGEYSNDPDDKGGETFCGISKKNFPNWSGWTDLSKGNRPTEESVAAFYRDHFWNQVRADEIDSAQIALWVFDTAVNMGVGRATQMLQATMNALGHDIGVDGKIGLMTIAALSASIRKGEADLVFQLLCAERLSRYINICFNNSDQKKFMRGWCRRVFDLQKHFNP